MMIKRREVLSLFALALAGSGPAIAATANTQQPAGTRAEDHPWLDAKTLYSQFERKGKGFFMQEAMHCQTEVYVAFDAQCTDSHRLWRAAKPLADRVTFIWLPVAVFNRRSEAQGVAILSAKDPVAAMERQIAEFSSPSRGLPTEGLVLDDEVRDDIWSNSTLFRRSGGRGVPLAIFKHVKGGYSVIDDKFDVANLPRLFELA